MTQNPVHWSWRKSHVLTLVVWWCSMSIVVFAGAAAGEPLVSADVASEQSRVLQAALDELEKCKLHHRDTRARFSEEVTRLRWKAEQDAQTQEKLRCRSIFDLVYAKFVHLYDQASTALQMVRDGKTGPWQRQVLLQADGFRIQLLRVGVGLLYLFTEQLHEQEKAFTLYLKANILRELSDHAEVISSGVFIGIPAVILALLWHSLTNKVHSLLTHVLFGAPASESEKGPSKHSHQRDFVEKKEIAVEEEVRSESIEYEEEGGEGDEDLGQEFEVEVESQDYENGD